MGGEWRCVRKHGGRECVHAGRDAVSDIHRSQIEAIGEESGNAGGRNMAQDTVQELAQANTGDTGAAAVAARLLLDFRDLRDRLMAASEHILAGWDNVPSDGAFRASASNLADYIALRSEDLRRFQGPLASLGLSTLGRAEGQVRANLDAVMAALSRIAGGETLPFPEPARFAEGRLRLQERRDALFGVKLDGPQTRIMATLPTEAAADPELARALVAEGVDCVRINCAHDSPEVWEAMIAHVGAAAASAGRPVAVVMDLGGPKVRTRAVAHTHDKRLHRGDRLALAATIDGQTHLPLATLSYPALIERLVPGTPVWFDDGKLRTRVVEEIGDLAVLEVTSVRLKGEKLRSEKGVSIPGVDLPIPALTEEDLSVLDFVARHADIVGYSFVQTTEDVALLVDELGRRCLSGRRPAIQLKIETGLAVRNLPELIVTAGAAGPVAVMIARGDLAVEIGFERLSEIQDEILWICEAAQVPVVWATQVLDDLLHEGQATRAETTDAAMGQRADCVMLNKGPYLPEAVAFLRSVLGRMERHQSKKTALLGQLHSWREVDTDDTD
jgi:pyruvate kinase